MDDFALDRELIDSFVAGTLDADAEAALAHEVARVLPFHWTSPNPLAAKLSSITKHLGGERALLDWLDRQPGRPHLVACLYRLIVLVDHLSTQQAIVTALRELRERTPCPPGLAGYLVPHTTTETLANLSWQIERLLGDERVDEAVQLAVAVVSMLRQIAPRAVEIDPALGDLNSQLDRMHQDILTATPHK